MSELTTAIDALDDIEVDVDGMCAWADVADALAEIRRHASADAPQAGDPVEKWAKSEAESIYPDPFASVYSEEESQENSTAASQREAFIEGANWARGVLTPSAASSAIPRPLEEWHEDMGPMLWWKFPIEEEPYVGSPLDVGFTVQFDMEMTMRTHTDPEGEDAKFTCRRDVGGWPGYHTHFTPIPQPEAPADPRNHRGSQSNTCQQWGNEPCVTPRCDCPNRLAVSGKDGSAAS